MGFLWTLAIFVGFIILVIFAYTYLGERQKVKARNIEKLQRMASQTNKYINKVSSVKTASAKINNCEKAIETLQQASTLPEYRDVFTNYDSMMRKLHCLKKVLPVDDYIKKADKHAFKKNESSEKNSLLDALYEIESNNITNEDFKRVELTNNNSGDEITIEYVESRLKKLGWER